MRLLHFGDLHIGMENYGRPDPLTGLNTRLNDFLRCFDEAIDFAVNEKVDLVIFTGDAFKSREPGPTYQREFAKRIHRLSRAGIPTVLLVGNHDVASLPGKADSLDIYTTLEVAGVWVGRRAHVHNIATASGPIQVATLPWMPRWAQSEPSDTGALIRALAAAVDPAAPAVLAAHCGVEGAILSSEARLMASYEPTVSRSDLANAAFDYVALGHIHRFQDLNKGSHPPVVYCGSMERVDFSEEGEQKGFVVVELEKGRAEYEFVPVSARRFVTVVVEADSSDATSQILAAIAAANVAEAVVRVRAVLREDAVVDDNAIREALRPAFWAGFTKEVQRRALPRNPRLTESMTDPLLALEEYLKTRRFSAERAQALREYARRLVSEVQGEAVEGTLAAEVQG